MPVTIDVDLCTGCALCEETCPTIFKVNDEGVCEVLIAAPEGADLECAQRAAEECPVEAIIISA